MLAESIPWLLFLSFVLAMLALDLGVFHRTAHEIEAQGGAWLERVLDWSRDRLQCRCLHVPGLAEGP